MIRLSIEEYFKCIKTEEATINLVVDIDYHSGGRVKSLIPLNYFDRPMIQGILLSDINIYKVDISGGISICEASAEDIISYIKTYMYAEDCYKAINFINAETLESKVEDTINAGKSDEAAEAFEESIKSDAISDFEKAIKDNPIIVERLGWCESSKLRNLRELLRLFK